MINAIYNIFFFLISIYILLKAIGYSIYEISENKNKSGGIIVIAFSMLVTIFSNIMMICQ